MLGPCRTTVFWLSGKISVQESTMARRVATTPLTSRMYEELLQRPRKDMPSSLLERIQKNPVPEQFEWMLSDGRIGGYMFDKHEDSVCLYTLFQDDDDIRSLEYDDIPRVRFSAGEWWKFAQRAWAPLFATGEVNGYKACFPGDKFFNIFAVFGERVPCTHDECIFICNPSYSGSIKHVPEIYVGSQHVVFKKPDISTLNKVFGMINRLFTWTKQLSDFHRIKNRLFMPSVEGYHTNGFTGRAADGSRMKQRKRMRPYNAFGKPAWVCDGDDDTGVETDADNMQVDGSHTNVYNKLQRLRPISGDENTTSIIRESQFVQCSDSTLKSTESQDGLLTCDCDGVSEKPHEGPGDSTEQSYQSGKMVSDEMDRIVYMMERCTLNDGDDAEKMVGEDMGGIQKEE